MSSSEASDDPQFSNKFSINIDDIDIPEVDVEECAHVTANVIARDDSSPLYSQCALSSVQVVSMLLSWYADFPGISKTAFSRMLVLLHDFILPKPNSLPNSYNASVNLTDQYLSPSTMHV